MNTHNKPTLSNSQIYIYALGEFGFTFFLLFVGYYLMYFLTDVLMLPAATAAILYTTVQWFETITVIISGALMDRMSFKNGKYRPWLIYGGVACFVGTFLFFTKFNMPVKAYIIAFPFFYLIAYWGYNFMWVAYRSLNGIIGKTPQDTISLTVSGSQLGTLSSLIFSVIGVKLLYGFSSISAGYSISALVYGSVMLLCLFAVYRLAAPFDKSELQSGEKVHSQKVPLKDTLKALTGPMVTYFISSTMRSAVTSVVNALIVYHFKYNLNNASLMSVYMLSVTLGQLLGIFLVRFTANRFGKKNMYILSSFASALALCCAYFFSMRPAAFIACMALNNFCSIFGGALMPAFMNDIAIYNEKAKHINTRAFTYSIGATAIRLASIIGGAAASFGLALIGYSSGGSLPQTDTLKGITALMTLLPSALMILCTVPMHFYKLNDKTMSAVNEKS